MVEVGALIHGYLFLRQIGEGGMANIFLVKSNKFNVLFAAKVIRPQPNHLTDIEKEARTLKLLDHNSIVRLYDYFYYADFFIMILENAQVGSAEDYVEKMGPFPESTFFCVAQDVINALLHMHHSHIAHRDIKPGNILLFEHTRAKIADFGISTYCIGRVAQFDGSLPFAAPEVLARQPHDPFAADIWALGVTFHYLLSGVLPWPNTLKEMMTSIQIGYPSISTNLSPAITELIEKMLCRDPKSRPTLKDLAAMDLFRPQKASHHHHSPIFPTQIGVHSLGKVLSSTNLSSTNILKKEAQSEPDPPKQKTHLIEGKVPKVLYNFASPRRTMKQRRLSSIRATFSDGDIT